MAGVIDDRRTDAEKKRTIGFIVATDEFMSLLGKGKSFFAVPIESQDQVEIVTENMLDRSDMKRPRHVGIDYRPKLLPGDFMSIRSIADCDRFYFPGGFRN